MPSTVMLPSIDQFAVLKDNIKDNTQAQCLPLFGSDHPKWTYRKVPKVTAFRNFGRLPPWCRRPQKMTYHSCAEDMTKTAIVPNLPEEDRKTLVEHGMLPHEPSAKDRFCVMCPVKKVHRDFYHIAYVTIGVRQSLPLPCSDLGSEEEDRCAKESIS